MFSQVSVCPQEECLPLVLGGCDDRHPQADTPWANTPWEDIPRQTPQADTPRQTPPPGRHPPGDTPEADTPRQTPSLGRLPPPQQTVNKRAVRIPLECIFLLFMFYLTHTILTWLFHSTTDSCFPSPSSFCERPKIQNALKLFHL